MYIAVLFVTEGMKKMKNPFISTTHMGREYLTSNCSLNKIKIAKLPLNGIEDELEGMTFKEIFGAGQIIEEIKQHADELHITLDDYKEMDLPKLLDHRVMQGNIRAEMIAKKYGNRLGMLLLTLKTGLPENRAARDDWNDEHWEYWAKLKTIILSGGLACGVMGKYMVDVAYDVFARAGVKPYKIIRNDNNSKTGAFGCLTQVGGKEKVHIVFDLGQTKIKRVIAINDEHEQQQLIELPSVKSINMAWNVENDEDRLLQARELHKYIVDVIVDTYNQATEYGEVGWEICISIANYVMDGQIFSGRGGYAKLSELGENYAGILAADLEKALDRNIMIRLIHDGTAAALFFKDEKDVACITLGTALGVGFPEINLKGKK